MTQRRYYVHLAIGTAVAHLLSVETPLPPNRDGGPSPAVAGYVYEWIADEAEWLSWMTDMDHSDADSVIMAQEMQGRDDVWIEIPAVDYVRLEAIASPAGSSRRPVSGYRTMGVLGRPAAILLNDRSHAPDLSPALEGLSLDPFKRGE